MIIDEYRHRQPPKKLHLYWIIWSENTVFFFNFMHTTPEHDDILSVLVDWCRFLINRKTPRLNPHILSQRLVEFFISLKTNLLCRVFYTFFLLTRVTITFHLYRTFLLMRSTKPGFQLHTVWTIIFSLEFPLKHGCFLTLLYIDILILKRELVWKNTQNSTDEVLQHLIWINIVVLVVCT